MNELHHVRAKWYDLGIQLRMETSHLDAIETQHRGNPDKCQRQMLSDWLNTSPPPPTWQRMVDALCSPVIDKKSSGERLRHIYCNPSPDEGNMFSIYQCHMSHFHFTECCKKPNDALKARILKLEKSFTRQRLNVYKLIRNEPVDVFVAGLLAMDVNGQEHHVPFLKEITKGKDSVLDIWSELSPYLNFLNYEILQHILFNFSDDSLQRDMDEYASMMEDFFQETRLCDFLECWPVRGKTRNSPTLSSNTRRTGTLVPFTTWTYWRRAWQESCFSRPLQCCSEMPAQAVSVSPSLYLPLWSLSYSQQSERLN